MRRKTLHFVTFIYKFRVSGILLCISPFIMPYLSYSVLQGKENPFHSYNFIIFCQYMKMHMETALFSKVARKVASFLPFFWEALNGILIQEGFVRNQKMMRGDEENDTNACALVLIHSCRAIHFLRSASDSFQWRNTEQIYGMTKLQDSRQCKKQEQMYEYPFKKSTPTSKTYSGGIGKHTRDNYREYLAMGKRGRSFALFP